MKYLVFTALFLASTFAIADFSTADCSYVDLEDARVLYQNATDYFFDTLATYKNDAVDGTTLTLDKSDCIMGISSFAGIDYRLTWIQYPLDQNGAKQLCSVHVLATPNGVIPDETEPLCQNQ
jgi:hypothetical protein